jgi:hypothetical protein
LNTFVQAKYAIDEYVKFQNNFIGVGRAIVKDFLGPYRRVIKRYPDGRVDIIDREGNRKTVIQYVIPFRSGQIPITEPDIEGNYLYLKCLVPPKKDVVHEL